MSIGAIGNYSDLGPSESYLGKYYCRLLLGKYTRTKPFEPQEWKPEESIFLPIPRELSDETSVNYNETNLEGVGDIINANPAGLAGRAFFNGVGPLAGALGNASLSGLGGSVLQKIGQGAADVTGVTAENITSALQSSTGYAPNPNPAVLFTGPDLREISFSWSFYPKTSDESYKIDKMIKLLKRSALPSHTLSSTTGVLKYPKLCQINFFPWDKDGGSTTWGWTNSSIIRIKKCFIKSVKVGYSDYGNPAFFEGTTLPVMYRLSISLQETEYVLSKDWEDTLSRGPTTVTDDATTFITETAQSLAKPIQDRLGITDLLNGAATVSGTNP